MAHIGFEASVTLLFPLAPHCEHHRLLAEARKGIAVRYLGTLKYCSRPAPPSVAVSGLSCICLHDIPSTRTAPCHNLRIDRESQPPDLIALSPLQAFCALLDTLYSPACQPRPTHHAHYDFSLRPNRPSSAPPFFQLYPLTTA